MKRIAPILLLAVLPAIQAFAREPENLFSYFLLTLAERHGELGTLAMPDVGFHAVPDIDNEALYILTFRSSDEARIFLGALDEEDIPHAAFLEHEPQIALFHQDILVYIIRSSSGFELCFCYTQVK